MTRSRVGGDLGWISGKSFYPELGQGPQRSSDSAKPQFKKCLNNALRPMKWFLQCPVQGQDFNSMILTGPFSDFLIFWLSTNFVKEPRVWATVDPLSRKGHTFYGPCLASLEHWNNCGIISLFKDKWTNRLKEQQILMLLGLSTGTDLVVQNESLYRSWEEREVLVPQVWMTASSFTTRNFSLLYVCCLFRLCMQM